MPIGNRPTRRSLLRATGTAIALPFLDAMIPPFARAATTAAASPTRMAFLYVPNGIVMKEWTPNSSGINKEAPGEWAIPAELPRITRAIAPYRKDLLILSGLDCNGGRALGDGPGDHGRAGAAYLTATHPRKSAGKDILAGTSVDQVAAAKLQGVTRFASLELGCEEGVQGGNCDNGYSCSYSNTLAWKTPTTPLPPEVQPRAVFERLFGSLDLGVDPAERRRQEFYEKSILDGVLEDARRLRSTLGASDRSKIDEYLTSVRDIETRIQSVERGEGKPSYPVPSPSVPSDFGEHARLMLDLMVLAFQSDLTRVATLLFSIEQSPRAYGAEIGIPEGHHGLTHHSGDEEKIEKVTQINCYHIQSLVYVLEKLKSIQEGDGTLLDHSMIAYGSGISDGNLHDHGDLPLILAGGAKGHLKGGRHIRYAEGTPMANLFVSMLDRMGVEPERFGDSQGKLDRLSI